MEFKHLFEATPAKHEGETGVFRSHVCKNNGNELLTKSTESNAETMYEVIKFAIEKRATKNIIGYRDMIEEIEESKEVEKKIDGKIQKTIKTWKYYHLSEYKWLTYEQVGEKIMALSSGLIALGIKPKEKVSFYAPASHNWFLLSYACFYSNLAVATVYDTLGADGLLYGITECESTTLILSIDQINVLREIKHKVKSLKNVIYFGDKLDIDQEFDNMNFISMEALVKLGQDNSTEPIVPEKDDLAVIMYTSGSTGNPKGVVLRHFQLAATVAGLKKLTEDIVNDRDRAICFLPLAHILAFILSTFCFSSGIELGFASPRTLLDASVRKCRGDIFELKPTLLPGVPQVFDGIRKGILNKVSSSGAIMQNVFQYSLSAKKFCNSWGLPSGWLDKLVFDKVREVTGGRLRLGLCGGAPVSNDLKEFFRSALCEVYQGYGMTEICGLMSLETPGGSPENTVGQLISTVEIKLVDFPEGGYFAKDLKGELWARGPSVTKEYFNNRNATEETITSDGWLKTGDIASINSFGDFTIIDRRKNLVKLANGEYIALEKLESIYKNSLIIQNICMWADPYQTGPVALVQPNIAALKRYILENNLEPIEEYEELKDREDLTKAVYSSCLTEAKKAHLSVVETLVGVFITPIEWTVENGILTGAQKIKRRMLEDSYKKDLIQLYSKS